MMRNRSLGIFSRIFLYTLMILFVVICMMAAFFANQFSSVISAARNEQLRNFFQPLFRQMDGASSDAVRDIAESFHEKNTSLDFSIRAEDGSIVYSTPGLSLHAQPRPAGGSGTSGSSSSIGNSQIVMPAPKGMSLYIAGAPTGISAYNDFVRKTAIAVALLLLASTAGAALFARQITRPIRTLAGDTKKMSELDFVPVPTCRKDEIGQLAGDVYRMYETLKLTIQKLETEMRREREMEESQRNFFSSASHELKTPVAAASAMLEGMLEGVVEPSEYRAYIGECLKMMAEQADLISEILEIVKLSDDRLEPQKESVNLKDAVLSALPACQALAVTNALTVSVEIPGSLRCMLEPGLFGRVLSNIVMNAVQNTPAGECIRIWSEEKGGKTARLCVLNTGASIESEVLPKLFEPFYVPDTARRRGSGKSGLGLAIVKKALDYMKIEFSLENTDEGVLFRMDLPV